MKKVLRLLVINFMVLLALWLLLEIVFGLILFFNKEATPQKVAGFNNSSLQIDSIIGYRAKPNVAVHACELLQGDTVYNVIYTIDSVGARKNMRNNITKTKTALFFGCSCTFGEGVADTNTIDYYYSILDSACNTFNFALSGYGTQQMASMLASKQPVIAAVPENTFAFYFYLDGHIQRNIGSMNVTNAWGKPTPYYTLENNLLKQNGLFSTNRKFTNALYYCLGKSQILRYFKIDFPLEGNEYGLKLTAALIQNAYLNYQKLYKNNNFYVVIFPGSNNQILQHIHDSNVKTLDYSTLLNVQVHSIAGDGHPNKFAYQKIAQQLATDISVFY